MMSYMSTTILVKEVSVGNEGICSCEGSKTHSHDRMRAVKHWAKKYAQSCGNELHWVHPERIDWEHVAVVMTVMNLMDSVEPLDKWIPTFCLVHDTMKGIVGQLQTKSKRT
mmetsp:Transcript_1005/g.1259  ORF Transcript_1005/g.1259 Transcript_1005/m.1259 type:complete len:111 (-) Transcript_1005:818-1150(-)